MKVTVKEIKNPAKPLVTNLRNTEIDLDKKHINYIAQGKYDDFLLFMSCGDIIILDKKEFNKL